MESIEVQKKIFWKSVLRNMHETPTLKEETILKELNLANNDPNIKQVLETIYLEDDRISSFERFCNSNEFKVKFQEILRHAKNNYNLKICEVGAGPGFLSVALAKAGFLNVSMLEPNQEWITGTGFISEIAKKNGVTICNDLDEWYKSDELYDIIITNACVHHFDNVSKVAAEIRCKISDNGCWLMFDEFFANTAEDLYTALFEHSHVIKYGQYEWPYSTELYVKLLKLVGFEVNEILPRRYKNNYISRNISGQVKFTSIITPITSILIKLRLTVFILKFEILIDNILGLKKQIRLFTLPQLLVFKVNKKTLSNITNI